MDVSKLTPLSEAVAFFPSRSGRHLTVRTLIRRIEKGFRGVRLRAVRDGHQWFTTQEWAAEFQSACTRTPDRDFVSRVEATLADHEESLEWLQRRLGINAANGCTEDRRGRRRKAEVPDVR